MTGTAGGAFGERGMGGSTAQQTVMIDAGKSDGVTCLVYGICRCRWDGDEGRGEKTQTWEEKRLILAGIDERKGITRFGERQRKRPGAGLVYVYVDVNERVAEISIDLVTGHLALSVIVHSEK